MNRRDRQAPTAANTRVPSRSNTVRAARIRRLLDRPMIGQRDRAGRVVGTKWERLPLWRAPDGFVMLDPALPYLHKPALIRARAGQVHSWGSRGRGFKSRRPDCFSNTVGTTWGPWTPGGTLSI